MGVAPGAAGAKHQCNTFLHDLILRKTGDHNAPIEGRASIITVTTDYFRERATTLGYALAIGTADSGSRIRHFSV